MKTYLIIILSVLFSEPLLAQSSCFDDCYQDYENSTLEFSEKSFSAFQGLIGCKLPDFNLKSIDGKTFSSIDLSGKVLVINFYFSSCAPCVAEIPALNKLVEEYKNKDVVFIAFSTDPTSSALNFVETTGFKYNVITSLLDVEKKFCLVGGWPTNMVVDKSGILRQVFAGGKIDEDSKIEAFDKMKPVIDKYLIEK